MSLRKVLIDTAAMSSVNVLRLLAQFLAVPILARLLSPADYGIVGEAMPFILFVMMIADAGVGMSLVRTPAQERDIWSTCYWGSLLLGIVLAILMAIASPLAAMAFNEPRLGPIIMALTFVVFGQALCTIPGAALQQAHQFKVVALVEIGSVIAGIGTAVIVALLRGGAWALVAQQIAFFAMRATLTTWLSPFRPKMVFNIAGLKEHLTFGRDVLSVNVVSFFTRSLDNLVIGKVLLTAAVGVYSMAFQFARLPMMLVTGPMQYVLYAKLAEIKDNKPAIRATFLLVTRMLSIIVFPLMGMVAAAQKPVFTLLLSEKWSAAGTLFMLATPASALQAVTGTGAIILLVLGHTDTRLRMTIEFGLLWIVALLASVWFGLEWVAIAYNIAVFAYTPRSMQLILPTIDCKSGEYWRTMLVPLLVTLIAMAAFFGLQPHIHGDWPQFAVAVLLGMAALAAGVFLQRQYIKDEVALWRSLHEASIQN